MKAEYIHFIQYSLDENAGLPENFDKIDWAELQQFCHRQSIMGVVFGGLERANKKIPQQVLFEWISTVQSIKNQNAIVNKDLLAVTNLFQKKGYRSVILKGQANGLMYPKPELRSPGDIDIWVDAPKIDIVKMVLCQCPKAHYSIHHIKLPIFSDVSVEVHYRPIYLTNWFVDKKLQKYVEAIEKKQFSNIELFGEGQIGTLTNEFNVVYQLLHMYAHFFSSRNNFKQFVDYYYLLKRGLTEKQRELTAEIFHELKIMKYARGMMWVMKEILGLDESYLIVEPSEKVGKVILRETMHYGVTVNNKLLLVMKYFVANLRLAFMFPSQVLISPLFLFWHQLWKIKMKFQLVKYYTPNVI